MEASPLTRQSAPEVFKPKIVQLYETLFQLDDDDDETRAAATSDDDHDDHDSPARKPAAAATNLPAAARADGFWTEFFLLKADPPALRRVLHALGPGDALLHRGLEARTRELFARATAAVRRGAAGGAADLHALDTLNILLSVVLAKKYAHASSDIIAVLAGIDRVDAVFAEFVAALEGVIRNGRTLDHRRKAVGVALVVTAGAYQTSLLTYFIQRDLFPSVMKFVHETDATQAVTASFTLLGLLANYNKFEFRNPYQLRLADFVNEAAIQSIIRSVGGACARLRDRYVDVQDDLPEGWTLSSTLAMLGLGAIAPGSSSSGGGAKKSDKKVVYDAESAKQEFAKLPGPEAAILLATYDFTHTNKLFCLNLVAASTTKSEAPLASFLSLTSYLLHHAHLSERTTTYSHLNLMTLRLLVEDAALCKRLCSADAAMAVRLCRQRAPHLPLVRGDRVPATAILDTMVAAVNHNLRRRRLDVGLYTLSVGIMLRIVSFLARSRTRLVYHWAELFRALLAVVKFLTTYEADLRALPRLATLLDLVVNLLALALSAGEAFLPSAAEYDDLFYKVVEAGATLARFSAAYALPARASNSIDTLTSVSAHYHAILAEDGTTATTTPAAPAAAPAAPLAPPSQSLTSQRVVEVIKQGYETLRIQTNEGLDSWERFREADERSVLKKMARAAVADVCLLEGQ